MIYSNPIGLSASPVTTKIPDTATEKELKLAAQEFTAIFIEKMFTEMMKTNVETKPLQENIWWDMLTQEIAQKIAADPNSLSNDLYLNLKKRL